MHLLVFGHVRLITEIIKVASIGLRVELWNEWGSLGAKRCPINFGKVLMRVDFLDVGESLALGCNTAV